LGRPSAAGAPEPLEVYMIRRNKGMKFLAGYYAFPGGKVDPDDAVAGSLARCHGLTADEATGALGADAEVTPLAFWVTAVRELLEESGVLLACDAGGGAVDATDGDLKFRGIVDRIDVFWKNFDWKANRWAR